MYILYKNKDVRNLTVLGIRNYLILNYYNKFYSTTAETAESIQPIVSLRDIVEYKTGIVKTNPYQGLLKGKENSKFKLGNGLLFPAPNEYSKYNDLCDWKSRIKQIINEELKTGHTYDIAVLGRDILNEEYITYGKHFLINSESNPDAVITKIEGNILVNSVSLNSGEIDVAANENDLESGLRLIVFLIRAVSFDLVVHKLANKLLLSKTKRKRTNTIKKYYLKFLSFANHLYVFIWKKKQIFILKNIAFYTEHNQEKKLAIYPVWS